jgi:hypothetical protein
MNSTVEFYSFKTVLPDYSWDYGTPLVEYNTFLTNTQNFIAPSNNDLGREYVGYAPFFSVTLSSAAGSVALSSAAMRRDIDFGDYYNQETNNAFTASLSNVLFCHNYVMPGLYTIRFKQMEWVYIQTATSGIYDCLDRYCINWTWAQANCLIGGFPITWQSTLTGEEYEKIWRFEGCDADWASRAGLYIQPVEQRERFPLSWQWYNFFCQSINNPKNTPVTWAQATFQGPEELTWSGTSGPCLEISTNNTIWRWDNIKCDTQSNPLVDPITWDETKCSEPGSKTWSQVALACEEIAPTLSAGVREVIKEATIRVLEIPPKVYLHAVDLPDPEELRSPLTVRLTPRYIKCGSFPIEKIVWDLGDGSPLITQRRWANISEKPFAYNSVFNLDYEDPRNFDIIHTYNKDLQTVYAFYPSITAYASSTGTTDCAATVIGPIQVDSTKVVAPKLTLLQNELVKDKVVLLGDIDNTIAAWNVDN